MNALRIIVPGGVSLFLLLAVSGCISTPGPMCGDLFVTAVSNSSVEIKNPCGPFWTGEDQVLLPTVGIPTLSVKRIVDANGAITRLLTIGPDWAPGEYTNPDLIYRYISDSGVVSGGLLRLTVLAPLQVSVTPNPAIVALGQTIQLSATVTGGSAPYTYLWSPPGPLITDITFPTITALPKQNMDITITVEDYAGRRATGTAHVTVTSGAPPPVLTGISPALGVTSGTSVTITGDNFLPGVAVQFGSTPAQYSIEQSSRTILSLAPPGTGTVDVKVTNPDGQSATLPNAFTYYNPLVISSLTAIPQIVASRGSSQLLVSATGGVPFTTGAPYHYQWTADPSLSNLAVSNPVATPTVTSVYKISVSDSLNNVASAQVTVTINSATLEACVSTLPPDHTVIHGIPATFDGRCSTGPNPIVLFEWWDFWTPFFTVPADISDPFTILPTFTYTVLGRATVRLRVTDSTGATSTVNYSFIIE